MLSAIDSTQVIKPWFNAINNFNSYKDFPEVTEFAYQHPFSQMSDYIAKYYGVAERIYICNDEWLSEGTGIHIYACVCLCGRVGVGVSVCFLFFEWNC